MSATYTESWESLIQAPAPEWLLDEKFGLYAHWGLYSVQGFGHEWYAKHMYNPHHAIHTKHCQAYGDPSEFGYKDFIPLFTAEHYDPDEWAELFQRSGAGYGGFSLAHHDGFGLWDSDVYVWNVGKKGPKRDLYGEFARALKMRGMKLVAPFHIIRGFNWFLPGWNQFDQTMDADAVQLGKAQGWDLYDPAYSDLYWNQFTGNFEQFLSLWTAKVKEVIDKYQPDLLWFDGGRFSEADLVRYALEVLAYYFNRAEEWGKDVSVLNKLPVNYHFNFHRDFGIWQFEAGRDRPARLERFWNDDLKIGSDSWGYLDEQEYLTGKTLIHGLIDRTARGGSLMLSLSPKGDGTIPEGQRKPLKEIGEWLMTYGEAIRGTSPWHVSGEGGDEKLRNRSRKEHPGWTFEDCGADDIRYTVSKDGKALYVHVLGKPTDDLRLEALGLISELLEKTPETVEFLGTSEPASWERREEAFYIRIQPDALPADAAYVWKLMW